jgi:anti-sigma factor RsiW
MTSCAEMKLLIHGLLDGELDAAHAASCEEHMAACPDCSTEFEGYRSLRQVIRNADLYERAPDGLRMCVLAALDAVPDAPRRGDDKGTAWQRVLGNWQRWGGAVSGLALAASLALFVAAPLRGPDLRDELVASHVRSLLVDHLTDVGTSDQHVVKPWFTGKLDFSPPVVDLASAGFPLVGGRIDYVSGRAVAALVLKRRDHVINLFIWPAAAPGADVLQPSEATSEGYNILHWTAGRMNFWAVSDLNMSELREFKQQFEARTRSPS